MTREHACQRFQDCGGLARLRESIGPNSLPESFRVKLRTPRSTRPSPTQSWDAGKSRTSSTSATLLDKGVQDLQRHPVMGLVVQGMSLAAFAAGRNTIQVAAYSKRRGAAVMQLCRRIELVHSMPVSVLEGAVVAALNLRDPRFIALFLGKVVLLYHRHSLTIILTPIHNINVWLMPSASFRLGAFSLRSLPFSLFRAT